MFFPPPVSGWVNVLLPLLSVFFPPLSEAAMMNIVQLIIKRRGRNPGDRGNGGGGVGRWLGRAEREGGNYQGGKLCRSMKNCTGILPPQLAVWEADLISGESVRLEL